MADSTTMLPVKEYLSTTYKPLYLTVAAGPIALALADVFADLP